MFNSYDVNWPLFIKRNVDFERRTPIRLAWLFALTKATRNLYDEFMAYRLFVLGRLQYSSAVITLEKGLNDRFNTGLPARDVTVTPGMYDGNPIGIYIDHPADVLSKVYVYRKSELIAPPVIFTKGEIPPNAITVLFRKSELYAQPSFIVYVPSALGDVESGSPAADLFKKQIQAFVELYRYASMKYLILNY